MKIQYQPFVKRLDLSVLGDEHEPVIIQMPFGHVKIASELNPEMSEWDVRNPAGANIERIVVVGLGAQEGYGPNVNGDGFHEEHLLAVPKDIYLGKQPYNKPMYQTFVDFSQLYKRHRNRMHDQAYGEIPFVSYNPKMRRVEIVVDLYADEKNNIDILENLIKNIFPAVSMGFRCVPGDVCSICQNYEKPFPARGHYCNHLRNNMLQIDKETGKLCYAVNPNGYFFDLSIVKKPADRIAWGMKRLSKTRLGKGQDAKTELSTVQKTASDIGMDFLGYSSKLAEEDGTTEIVKLMEREIPQKKAEVSLIPDGVRNVMKNNPDPYFEKFGLRLANRTDLPISNEILDYITKHYPLKVAFTTMVSCGIWPKPQEFQRMILIDAGQEKYANYLEKENIVFDLDSVKKPDYTYDITTGQFDPKLAEDLRESETLDQRSYFAPFLMKRAAMIKEAITMREFFDKYPLIPNPLPRKKLPENYQEQMIARGMAASPQGQYYTRNPNPVMNDGRYVSAQPAGTSVKHKANPIIPLAVLGALYMGGRWLAGFTTSGPLSKAMAGNPLALAGAFGATAAITWIAGRVGIPRPEKTGSIKSTAASLGKDYALHILAGIGISYSLAARAENKRIIGKQPNILEEAAEKRPALGAALIGLGTRIGAGALVGKFGSEELESFEAGVMANDLILGEYEHDYIDKMARLSLNHSAFLLKK
jgi:hypothetical protein